MARNDVEGAASAESLQDAAPSHPMQAMPPTLFRWPVRVYWEDTDAGGIVFYANYLKYFERARTEWLRALGLEQQRLREESGAMFVVSDAQLKYHAPARLDDQLCVTAALQQLGRSSFTMEQQALLLPRQGGEPALLCSASIRIGWVDASSLKPARMPPNLLRCLQP